MEFLDILFAHWAIRTFACLGAIAIVYNLYQDYLDTQYPRSHAFQHNEVDKEVKCKGKMHYQGDIDDIGTQKQTCTRCRTVVIITASRMADIKCTYLNS